MPDFEIVRDPLWNNIRLDPLARRLVDTPVFQRLRYVRQLGHAYLVYPGATHSRFEHALGAYHLASITLVSLRERGILDGVAAEECTLARVAALLHDVGHYPFSHALEEIGVEHHESVARPLLTDGPVAHLLRERVGPDAPERVHELICGESASPLQGLISGSLDLDKIEYLKRDAHMCGVPYGEIDVDRLLHSLLLLDDPETGRRVIGVHEKGVAALESLLFAKYQMYRNVYWHHAVRSATAMYKRLVDDALRSGRLAGPDVAGLTDEGIMHRLESEPRPPLLAALRERRLYKRALEVPAAELGSSSGPEWIASDRELVVRVEDALALELGLAPGELLLDFPAKTQMIGLDIAMLGRDGRVRRLTGEGWPSAVNLPRVADELYRTARWLRVLTARRMQIPVDLALAALTRSPESLRGALDRGERLLR
ncbi:MAG TPA: HD domain-containing protein [Gemmatimonadales bacterium]